MNFSGYNNQQQQQQQQQRAYEYYDPSSQIQPYEYDQSYSYQPYYAYTHPQYAYFPDTHQPHLQFQPEPAPVHPPGVNPPAPEPAQPRPAHPPTGPSQYRSRGGRGGRPFRRGGRGRGRGLSGVRHFPSHSSGPAITNVADTPAAAAGATSVVQSSSSIPGQTPPKPAQVPAAPLQPPPRKVWCEICKAECNTPEILEQHNNGKRHKKNMKVHEELQKRKAVNGQQSGHIPSAQLNLTDQPKKVQESEKQGCPTENMGAEVTADNHKDEKDLHNNVGETSKVPAEEPKWKSIDNSSVRGRGLKRKMRGGRGCKYTRTNDGSRMPVEPPKPEQAMSFICELCNVKCESQVVYHSHLTGKKHLSSLKRVHGKQALSEVVGLQAVYPPDINALSNSINAQVQQGVTDPQVLLAQLLMTVLSQAQVPAIAPPSGPVAAQIPALPSVAGPSYEPQLSQSQVSKITAHVEMENPTGETKNQLLPLELDALAGSSISTQIAGGSSDPQVLLTQLLMTVLSQAQVPAIAPPSGPVAAQIPAPTSVARPSYEPQMLQTQVSEIAAHVEMENPTGETKKQLLSVPLELDALAGSSISTQIVGGSSETKEEVQKHPQDSSGVTPADNSGAANDQIT